MTQTLLPTSTVSAGSWSPGAYTDVDTDDGTFAQSETQNSAPTTTFEVGLTNPASAPAAGTCTLRVRWKADGGGGAFADAECRFQANGTTLATITTASTLGTTEVEETTTFSTAAVSNWLTDTLTIELQGTNVRRKLYVDLTLLEIPDAAAGTDYDEIATDDAGVSDSVSFALGKIESVADDVGVTDATTRVVAWVRNITEAVGVGDPVVTDPPEPVPYDDVTYFAPPDLLGGDYDTTDPGELDEWPISEVDGAQTNNISNGASGSLDHTFDLSAAPGAKKGFRLWFKAESNQSAGFSVDEIRLVEAGGPTTLHTDASPDLPTIDDDMGILTYDFPDSAFAGDPDIDQLRVEIDITNLHGGNNTLTMYAVRLSKSPFETSEEIDLPASIAGADYAYYSATALRGLGAPNGYTPDVIPDVSGRGRHAVRMTGTDVTLVHDTIDYFDCPTGHDTRYGWKFDHNEIDDNSLLAMRSYPTNTASDHPVVTGTFDFSGVALAPGSKLLLGYSSDQYVIMAGDGSGGAHKTGGSPAEDTWAWSATWTQTSGNEHAWEDDNTTPVIDAASGSNTLHGGNLYHHEASDRQFEGRNAVVVIVSVPAATYVESDMTDALDEWVNGPSVTDYEETVTDSVAVDDPVVRVHVAERERSEGVGLADSVIASKSITIEIDEAVGVADSVVVVRGIARTVTVTAGVVDTTSHATAGTLENVDAVGAGDSVTRVLSQIRVTTDSVDVTDTVESFKTISVAITDAVGAADATTRIVAGSRDVIEPVGGFDTTQRLHIALRTVAESVGVTDVVDTAAAGETTRTVSDGADVADTVVRTLAIYREVTDSVGVADEVTPAKTVSVEVTDSGSVADSTVRTHDAVRTSTDPVGVTGVVSSSVEGGNTVIRSEGVSVSDSTNRLHTAVRVATDSVGVFDSVAVAKAIVVDVTESVGAVDTTDPAATIVVVVTDPASVTDITPRLHTAERIVTETAGVTDTTLRTAATERQVTEAVEVADSTSTIFIVDGTPWWQHDPVAYTGDESEAEPDMVSYVANPAGYTTDPAGYEPAIASKNPPL